MHQVARQPEGGNIDTVSKACAFGDFEKLKAFVDADPGKSVGFVQVHACKVLSRFLQYENATS
jgi:hypothetical protein